MSSFNSTEPLFSFEGDYSVERQISSPTGSIYFIVDKISKQPLCIKMWEQPTHDWSQGLELSMHYEYLIEGLHFNRNHAPGVYLGVAPVELINESDNDIIKIVRLKTLLPYPQKKELNARKKYALIMRSLNEKWQLSYLLTHELDNEDRMRFLAREIYHLHKEPILKDEQLELVRKKGGLDTLLWKLSVNNSLFKEALALLFPSEVVPVKYTRVSETIKHAYEAFQELFEQRIELGQIKRCHGDLKATNLWIRPALDSTLGPPLSKPQLLALDCIDFQPEFCYIDTLSDLAMLAVDIESYLTNNKRGKNVQQNKALLQNFLDSYFACAQESSTHILPLLEYYMTEKAMVRTFVNILYDNKQDAGKQFLAIASSHAQNLRHLL